MARRCLLLLPLVLIQLWLLPLSWAARSLRGVASSGDDVEQMGALTDSALFDVEIEGGKSIGEGKRLHDENEAIARTRPRRTTRGLAKQNATSTNAVDRFHRNERTEGRADLPAFQTRIIGGKIASASEDSFAVSIQDRHGNHFCGGTLVSKDTVLTAAHCSSKVTGKGPIRVVIGRHTLSTRSEGETLAVRSEKIHPRYDVKNANRKWQYDFALLFTQRPFMTKARVVELNSDPNVPRGGTLVSVFGWGDTHPGDDVYSPSDALQVANLRTVSNKQCDSMYGTMYGTYAVGSRYGYVHGDMMCAKSRRRDGCQGDSGGPLTHRGRQVGLTSWGAGCNTRGLPGVYARISSAYHWIRRNVCSRSMFPDPQFKCRTEPL